MADLSPKSTAWSRDDVQHLARRAGFGLTPEEADAFVATHGSDGTLVDHWVDGTDIDRSAFVAAVALADPVAEDGVAGPHPYLVGVRPGEPGHPSRVTHAWRNDLSRAQASLAWRMQYDPHPFPERMALFLHNLFATGQDKVNNVALMLNQWEMLAARCLDRYDDLLVEVSKDAAMAIWLDGVRNNANPASGSRGVPNENYAREVMELYSLGVDNGYNQVDITELAVALAGWSFTVAPGDVSVEPGNADNRRIARGTFAVYDGGPTPTGHLRWSGDGAGQANLPNMRRNPGTAPSLTFLGRSFQAEEATPPMAKGEALIRSILELRPAGTPPPPPNAAVFLAVRLLRHFVTAQFTAGDVQDLARVIDEEDFQLRPIMKRLLKSNYFYANRHALVEGPVSWAVRAARALGHGLDSAAGTPSRFPAWAMVAPAFDAMGMKLLDPNGPNGWKEDAGWLNSNAYRYRTKLAAAAALAESDDQDGAEYVLFPSDPNVWIPPASRTTPAAVHQRLAALLQPGPIPSLVITNWLEDLWPSGALAGWNDADRTATRKLAFLMLCSPGGQLY